MVDDAEAEDEVECARREREPAVSGLCDANVAERARQPHGGADGVTWVDRLDELDAWRQVPGPASRPASDVERDRARVRHLRRQQVEDLVAGPPRLVVGERGEARPLVAKRRHVPLSR